MTAPYPTPPPEIDTAESQADWFADVQRAMDEDEARRPSAAELARDEAGGEW